MLCIIGMRNCTLDHGQTRTNERCERCGNNLDEYNRRIADIRKNGLQRVGKNRWGAGIMGYKVKKPDGKSRASGTPSRTLPQEEPHGT